MQTSFYQAIGDEPNLMLLLLIGRDHLLCYQEDRASMRCDDVLGDADAG